MISAINFNESVEMVFTEAVFSGGRASLQPIVSKFQEIKDLLEEQINAQKNSDNAIEDAKNKAKAGEKGSGFHKIVQFNPIKFWKNTKWKDLEDELQKVFGFRIVNVNPWNEKYISEKDIFASNEINAFVYRNTRYPVDGLVTDNGFYDRSRSLSLDVHMSLGLIHNMSANEIVAVLLHEIGHSIDPALCDIKYTGTNVLCKYITDRKGAINKDEQQLINNTKKTLSAEKATKSGSTFGLLPIIFMVGNTISSGVKKIINSIGDFFKGKEKRQQSKIEKLQKLMEKDTKEFNRREYTEAFADNFARMYGFGAEMATALKKLSKDVEKKVSRIEKERKREEAIYSITEAAIKDIHKTDVHRVKALIKEYYADIDDPNTPPAVKKQLQDDVKEVESVLNAFTNDFSEFQNRINKMISDELDKLDDAKSDKLTESVIMEGTRRIKPVSKNSAQIKSQRANIAATKIEKLTGMSALEMKNIPAGDQDKIKKAMNKLFNDTKLPSIRLTITDRHYKDESTSGINLVKTKFGGKPYWPKDMEWPKSDGKDLICIAQLNFSELPEIPGFPTKGILQFFVLNDEIYMVSDSRVQIIYHKDIVATNQFNEKLLQEFPRTTLDDNDMYSIQGVFYPKATKGFNGIGYSNEQWYPKFLEVMNETFGTSYTNTNQFNIPGLVSTAYKYYITEFGEQDGSRIGGHPYFTQNDIRDDNHILLLQIDSEGGIMWGDCGVANFFCTPETLRSLDFKNKVLFNWDCC